MYPLWVRTRIAGGAIRRGGESHPVWVVGLAILGCWIAERKSFAADPAEVVLPRISQWELGDDGRWKVPAPISPHRIQQVGWGTRLINVAGPDPESPRAESRIAPPEVPEQDFRVRHWTVHDGLPDSKVRSLARTSDGFLWVGTARGVVRFDGVRFQTLGEPGAFSARALLADEQDRVWVGTDHGLHCIRGRRLYTVPGAAAVSDELIHDLALRQAGGIWVVSARGVGFVLEGIYHRLEVPGLEAATAVSEAPGGLLWIGTMRGILAVDAATGEIRDRRLTTVVAMNGSIFDDVVIRDLLHDRTGALWIGGNYGVWTWQPGREAPELLNAVVFKGNAFPGNARLAEDVHGDLWATSQFEPGIVRFGHREGKHLPRRLLPQLEGTRSVLADPEGGVWMGSDQGLIRLTRAAVLTFSARASVPLGAQWRILAGIDGSLWTATTVGSATLAGQWTGASLRMFQLQSWMSESPGRALLPLSGLEVGVQDLEGIVWRLPLADPAPVDPGVRLQFNTNTGPLQLRVCAVDQNGVHYLASNRGLFRREPGGTPVKMASVPDCDIAVLRVDDRGGLWLGTSDLGLCRLEGGVFRRITGDAGGAPVVSLALGFDGALWVGFTNGFGRCVGGVVQRCPVDPDLEMNGVMGLIEDDFHDLWLNHRQGIARVRHEDLEAWIAGRVARVALSEFGVADGLTVLDASTGSQNVARTADGRLWFGKKGGLAIVDPRAVRHPLISPRVVLESLEAGSEPVAMGGDARIAASRGRSIRMGFSVPNLQAPERMRVQHRLEGLESEWQDTGQARVVTYSDLRPGQYRFWLRARNHEGRWNKIEAMQSLRVEAPFWQTMPVRVGGGVLVAGLLAGCMRWQLGGQRRRLERDRSQALDRERHRIAQDLHDHLGSRLAEDALAGPEVTTSRTPAREVLRELNDLIWSVHPTNDTIASLADFVASSAERFLGAAGMETELRIAENLPDVAASGLVRREVSAMFKECLRNVVQHSGARRVTVSLEVESGWMRLAVRDDGRGFDATGSPADSAGVHGGGQGMRNLRHRAGLLGGRVEFRTAPGHGTEVLMDIPLGSVVRMGK